MSLVRYSFLLFFLCEIFSQRIFAQGNVAPTATFSNNGPVSEGSVLTVNFSAQYDPDTADVTAGFHYAYHFGYVECQQFPKWHVYMPASDSANSW